MFMCEDVALLLSQRLALADSSDVPPWEGWFEAIEDAGHRVVHGWMRANVRLAKRVKSSATNRMARGLSQD